MSERFDELQREQTETSVQNGREQSYNSPLTDEVAVAEAENHMVRRLHKGDISDFFPLRLEALERDPTAFGSSYEEEMAKGPAWLESILSAAKDNNAVFGAFYETKLVGTIGIYSDHHVKSSHKVTIWGMYVRSDYRRKGLGKALVAKAIDHAKFK